MDARTWQQEKRLWRQPVVLLGLGGVGCALLEEVLAARRLHDERYGLRLAVVAVADSGARLQGRELDDDQLNEALRIKKRGDGLDSLAASSPPEPGWLEAIQPAPLVADNTATDAVTASLTDVLSRGGAVALANKKPLTGPLDWFQRLTVDPSRSRWESTVGSGLPVNATLARIVASGDRVESITGAFSGTLGFLMTGLEQGRAFSKLVREAHSKGYTEPDPRDDLGGLDVARKALILARTLGWPLQMEDVEVEGLYPAGELDTIEPAAFLASVEALDDGFRQRVEGAAAAGRCLRYAARVGNGRCRVGPVEVDRDSPLGRLRGNDNLIEFLTGFFQPNPLVIQGRGAGVAATAAGVLADLVELALTARAAAGSCFRRPA